MFASLSLELSHRTLNAVICLVSLSMKRQVHGEGKQTCLCMGRVHVEMKMQLTCLCSPPRAQNPSGLLELRISPSASSYPRCISQAEASQSLQVVGWGEL